MNKLGQVAYDAYIKVAMSGREKGACFQAIADAVEKEVRNSMRCETCDRKGSCCLVQYGIDEEIPLDKWGCCEHKEKQ